MQYRANYFVLAAGIFLVMLFSSPLLLFTLLLCLAMWYECSGPYHCAAALAFPNRRSWLQECLVDPPAPALRLRARVYVMVIHRAPVVIVGTAYDGSAKLGGCSGATLLLLVTRSRGR